MENISKTNYMRTDMVRGGGLVGKHAVAVDFGPGDSGLISSLCVTRCFLSHWIEIQH